MSTILNNFPVGNRGSYTISPFEANDHIKRTNQAKMIREELNRRARMSGQIILMRLKLDTNFSYVKFWPASEPEHPDDVIILDGKD